MGEIVNLRRARKRQAVVRVAELAAENRVRHGRTKGQKAADRQVEQRLKLTLDAARIEEKPNGIGSMTLSVPKQED